METFSELKRWLDEIPDQVDGFSMAFCETGEPYERFHQYTLCRPGDEVVMERLVAERMFKDLDAYLKNRCGRLYWRIRFEWEVSPTSVIDKFDENGPDTDFATDRRCYKDHNWVKVAAYCRLYRSHHQIASYLESLQTVS